MTTPHEPRDGSYGARARGFAPGGVSCGVLRVPGSKSLAQRLLIVASLASDETRITALPDGEDVLAARRTARLVATEVEDLAPAAVRIVGRPPGPHRGWSPPDPLPVGESGTLARLALAALGFCGRAGAGFELAPFGTLARRSSPALVDALRAAGVGLESASGGDARATFALRVRPIGPPSDLVLERPSSSQEVSALLVALAAYPDEIELVVVGAIPSRPYLEMTLALLRRFGVAVETAVAAHGEERFRVRGPLRPGAAPWVVEPDASSAAVALAAGCLSGGELRVPGLSRASTQGDVRIVDHLAAFGCDARADEDGLFARGAPTRCVELDLEREPDLAPVLAAVAAAAAWNSGARSTLTGLGTLPGKESSRIAVLAGGLAALGFEAHAGADRLAIGPGACRARSEAIELDPHGDHRMAFAFALLGLVRPGVWVRDADCVRKSWPRFWRDLERAGVRVVERA
ncbi:MAG: hypothetical protein IPJ77_18055 [Planctomycetes bacterium]|nr:hypothetical protein [Planctomycetota bacterium]